MSGVWVPHPVPLDLDHIAGCSDCRAKMRELFQDLSIGVASNSRATLHTHQLEEERMTEEQEAHAKMVAARDTYIQAVMDMEEATRAAHVARAAMDQAALDWAIAYANLQMKLVAK